MVAADMGIYKVFESQKPLLNFPPQPTSWTPDRKDNYAKRLDKLDPEIGKTYRSVWEILYGTKDSPERNAMFAMRQVFDHLFRKLSPDNEVRNSEFFKPKEGNNPNQIYRKERILYAANNHIKDNLLAETLESKAQNVIANYKRLNKAHGDKPIDRELAKEVLTSMQGVIEEWVDALEL